MHGRTNECMEFMYVCNVLRCVLACMYACMYARMHVCMNLYNVMHVFMCVCNACMHAYIACMHGVCNLCAYVHTRVHAYSSLRVQLTPACVYACVLLWVYVRVCNVH